MQGAKLVFHPNLTGSDQQGKALKEWGHRKIHTMKRPDDARHGKHDLFCTSNYAFRYPESASSIIAPDGSCIIIKIRGSRKLFVADIDPDQATGLLAKRFNRIFNNNAT